MPSACEACVCGVSFADGDAHGCTHIGRQVGGGLGDELDEAFFKKLHFGLSAILSSLLNRGHGEVLALSQK